MLDAGPTRATSRKSWSTPAGRRALDYLVGFNLSPLLWKKSRRGLSAGRVQSPALRLICEREAEIRAFVSQEYWSIHLDSHKGRTKFSARLTHYQGNKLDQFDIPDDAAQAAILAALNGQSAQVSAVEKKKSRSPAAPFTTSTLQQEAVRKLGMTTDRAMRAAQQLYEGVDVGSGGTIGLITYMRTDSVALANEAVTETVITSTSTLTPTTCPKRQSPSRTRPKRPGSTRSHPPDLDTARRRRSSPS